MAGRRALLEKKKDSMHRALRNVREIQSVEDGAPRRHAIGIWFHVGLVCPRAEGEMEGEGKGQRFDGRETGWDAVVDVVVRKRLRGLDRLASEESEDYHLQELEEDNAFEADEFRERVVLWLDVFLEATVESQDGADGSSNEEDFGKEKLFMCRRLALSFYLLWKDVPRYEHI